MNSRLTSEHHYALVRNETNIDDGERVDLHRTERGGASARGLLDETSGGSKMAAAPSASRVTTGQALPRAQHGKRSADGARRRLIR